MNDVSGVPSAVPETGRKPEVLPPGPSEHILQVSCNDPSKSALLVTSSPFSKSDAMFRRGELVKGKRGSEILGLFILI